MAWAARPTSRCRWPAHAEGCGRDRRLRTSSRCDSSTACAPARARCWWLCHSGTSASISPSISATRAARCRARSCSRTPAIRLRCRSWTARSCASFPAASSASCAAGRGSAECGIGLAIDHVGLGLVSPGQGGGDRLVEPGPVAPGPRWLLRSRRWWQCRQPAARSRWRPSGVNQREGWIIAEQHGSRLRVGGENVAVMDDPRPAGPVQPPCR